MTGPPDLLQSVLSTPDDKLVKGAAQVEGFRPQHAPGVHPIYRPRRQTYYHITEQELSSISLANWILTGCVTLGTSCVTFLIDIGKDTLLANDIPQIAKEVFSYLNPILIFFAVAFYAAAGGTFIWRARYIDGIRKESPQADNVTPPPSPPTS